jgi:hypothetical protein
MQMVLILGMGGDERRGGQSGAELLFELRLRVGKGFRAEFVVLLGQRDDLRCEVLAGHRRGCRCFARHSALLGASPATLRGALAPVNARPACLAKPAHVIRDPIAGSWLGM